MNIELLQQVKAYILAEPRRLNMGVVMTHSDSAPCGSAGCIDGWAQYLSLKAKAEDHGLTPAELIDRGDYLYHYGRSTLGLDGRQAARLFTPPDYEYGDLQYGIGWPSDLRDRYINAISREERASITAERIDRFIASNGEE